MNNRNHRKIIIIDGQVGYVGGFNIGDDYLGLGKLGYWRDTHLRVQGDSIDALQLRFILDWNSQAHRPQFEYDQNISLKRLGKKEIKHYKLHRVDQLSIFTKLNMVIQK